MFTLLHRTGVERGRVYNDTGVNLTAEPAGAGNLMVGPWARDYASFTTSLDDVMGAFSYEYSGIIMDGRQLTKGSNNDDSLLYPDLDEDEDLSDRGSIIGRDTRSANLHSAQVRLYHTAPAWEDAFVWSMNTATGAVNQVAQLDRYLDIMALEGTGDSQAYDHGATSEDFIWHPLRHALRVPVMWAIYRIPLSPIFEGLVDMIINNSATIVEQSGRLAQGPAGMLVALHGNTYSNANRVNLWEPQSTLKVVARGMFDMPYDSAHEDLVAMDGSSAIHDPDQTAVNDVEIDGGVPQNNIVGGPFLDTPAQRARGRIHTTLIRCPRVRARPDEVLVWHLTTCPVRVATVRDDVDPGVVNHHIVGNAISHQGGGFMRLVYHEGTARFSAR